jgi:hypothetical protein
MKKILLICAIALSLTACADKQQYEETVLAEMKKDPDVKDYKILPEDMARCVVELSSKKMPGLFPFDPDRLTAYKNYTKMLSMSTVKDKEGMLKELRENFGSPKALADAHSNYTESMMNCMASTLMRTEDVEN